jgi:uncharacterized protein (TIGR00251 family)
MPRAIAWEETDQCGHSLVESKMPQKIQLKVKVIPRAKKQELITLPDGSLRVKLRSVPEKGKANKELIKLIASHYNVSRSSVIIIKGEFAREKVVSIVS